MDNPTITLKCMNGYTLYAKGGNLVVKAKRTENTYPISNIQSFSLKEPRALSAGSIVFRTAQAASAGIEIGLGISAALGAEQSFFFTKAELSAALQLRDYVSNHDSKESTLPGGMVVSVVEEIRGLKGLLDDGIISQEEFNAKKRSLLGL